MSNRLSAISITLIYAACAAVWIVVSGTLLNISSDDAVLNNRIEIFKGLAFVAVTSALLYALVRAQRRVTTESPAGQTVPAGLWRLKPAPGEWALLLALVLTVPLVGFGVYLMHSKQSEIETYRNLSVIANLKTKAIEDWLADRRADADVLAASGGFIERVGAMQAGVATSAREQALVIDRLNAIRKTYRYDAVTMLDNGGKHLFTLGEAVEFPPPTRALAAAAMASGTVTMAPLQRDTNAHLHLDFIVPLVKQDNGQRRVAGVVILHLNPERAIFPSLQNWPASSHSGEILLVRRDGDAVQYLNVLRHRTGPALTQRDPLTDTALPSAAAVLQGQSGSLRGIDYRGVAVFAAWQPVAGTDWHIVAKIDRDEALHNVRALAAWVSGLALFAVTIMGIALIMLLRQRRQAQELAYQAQTDKLFRQFYNLPFIGMAITSPQTKHWVRFNDRLCEILGYSREELAQLSWAQMTHPDDLDKDVAEFDRVMRGESEGYAMEKRFIRKDGTVIHAEIDVKCTRKADGGVDYFVATIQDINERKADETRISRLGQLYAALSRCNEVIMRSTTRDQLFAEVCRAVAESGGVLFAWIGLHNNDTCVVRPVASFGNGAEYLRPPAGSPLNGGEPMSNGPTAVAVRENRPVWCQDFRNDPTTALWHERADRHGWRASASLPLQQDGAVVGAITLYADTVNAFDGEAQQLLLRIAANIGFALDSLEHAAARHRIEQDRAESEERYRLLFDNSLDAVLLSAPDGVILKANAAACRMLQRSEEELRQVGRSGVVDESDPRLAAAMEERHRTGHFAGEVTMIRKDGTKFPAEISTSVFTVGNGQQRSSLVIRDITERQQSEQVLAASEQQFRGMIEQSVTGFFVIQDGKLKYANQRLADILGFSSPKELLGLDALTYLTDQARPAAAESMRRQAMAPDMKVAYETQVRRKDGVIIDIGSHSFHSSFRGQPAIIGLVQDISEKKRAEEEIQRYVKQLEAAFMSTVEVATTISEMRDPYTAGHEKRVAEIAVAIGREMGFDERRLEGLRVAGYLHDTGKITIPSEILSKPGKLSATELELVRQHARAGYDVLKNVTFPWPVAEVALQHHERIDGSGYPQGLKGDEIAIEARIMAVADVVESMASHRPYRPGLGIDKALEEIERGRGTAYDTTVADTCLALFRNKGYVIPV